MTDPFDPARIAADNEALRTELANCVSLLALIRRDYLRPRDLPHSVDAAVVAGRAALARSETRAEKAA